MILKKSIKIYSFLLIFAMGIMAIQSCCSDKKEKKNDIQTTEVKAESNDSKCGEGKCGDDKATKEDSTQMKDGKCGDDKTAKDSTMTKEGKCGSE